MKIHLFSATRFENTERKFAITKYLLASLYKTKFMIRKIALATVIITTIFIQFSSAQYCGNSGTAICVPGSGLTYLDGFKPPYDSLPCAQKGIPFDQTIRFVVPPTVTSGNSTYDLNWLEIATISNLPCGLCWSTNKSTNRFNKNEQACIRVTGTTYDNPGQFKLNIFVNVNVTVPFLGSFTQNNQNASQAGLKYYLRVEQNNGSCIVVDTFAAGNTATSLGADFTATVAAGGATTFCDGGSVLLTAAPAASTSYQWYNGSTAIQGATSPTYSATTSGNYNVKVVKGCKGFTSASTTVSVTPRPAATITPAGPIQLCNGNSQLLTASPANASYVWLENGSPIGATGQTYTATASGNYSVSVTENGCSSISNIVTASTGGSTVTVTPTASSQTICSGQTVTLDAGAGFSSYAWSGGGSGRTKDVTSASTYTVTVTLSSGGCTSTGNGSVTITNGQNVPAITSLPATTAGCVGTAVILDADTGYTTYSWTGGGATQTITPVNSGPYSVTVTKTGFCGNATATTTLTINPLPQITLSVSPNPATACPNLPATLDAGAGYDTYDWSNGATSPTIQGEMDSSYTVTVTKTELGCTASEFLQVDVANAGAPNAPNLSPTYAFCTGDSAYLATGVGFNSYNWSTGDTVDFVWIKTSNTYSVTVTQAGRCGTTVATTTVTENSRPDASFTNNGGVLTANATSGVSYTWLKNNAPISNANSSTFTPTESGNYSLQVNDGNCTNRSSAVNISVGINEIGQSIQLMAVPNPSSGVFSINFNLPHTTEMNIKLMDMAGRVILENNNVFAAGQNQLPLDISNFNNGLYLLNLQSKEGNATLIVIKQ
jgi:hypothetical protein